MDAVETMAWANEVPWHGLGVKVEGDLTPEEMLVKASLNWGVEKRAMFTKSGELYIPIPDSLALVRDSDDKILSIVGKNWNPVQNADAFEFFQKFVEAGHMTMETAGSLMGGKYVWALAKFSKSFKLGKGKNEDIVEGYLLLLNPHLFGYAMIAQCTPIRVVCWNTLNLALGSGLRGNSSAFKMHHSKVWNAETQKQAELALGLAEEQMDEFQDAAKLLSDKRANPEEVEEFFCEILKFDPTKAVKKADGEIKEPRNLPLFRQALEFAPGQQLNTATGTWWGAFNAVTYVVDHKLGRTRETALGSAWVGDNARVKRDALQLALEKAA